MQKQPWVYKSSKKLTANSPKQLICDESTLCAMLILRIICIWPNVNAGSKTTFPLISQDCFHCTHLHQQDMLLLCSLPPPQALVQVQKSWPLQRIRYELIPFLNRTQQQSGNRHLQGSFLWKDCRDKWWQWSCKYKAKRSKVQTGIRITKLQVCQNFPPIPQV